MQKLFSRDCLAIFKKKKIQGRPTNLQECTYSVTYHMLVRFNVLAQNDCNRKVNITYYWGGRHKQCLEWSSKIIPGSTANSVNIKNFKNPLCSCLPLCQSKMILPLYFCENHIYRRNKKFPLQYSRCIKSKEKCCLLENVFPENFPLREYQITNQN